MKIIINNQNRVDTNNYKNSPMFPNANKKNVENTRAIIGKPAKTNPISKDVFRSVSSRSKDLTQPLGTTVIQSRNNISTLDLIKQNTRYNINSRNEKYFGKRDL